MKHIKEFEQFVAEAKSYSGKFKKVYDNLNKGDEVTIKYGSSISRNNEVTFIVKKGKTTVGKAKVERITLVNKANPKGVKYYLYNRNGNISLAIGDMGATIDDIQMNESLKESISELMESETLAESSYPSKLTEGKFKVDDLVYNKRTKTVGIVRMGDDKYGEVKTDADGNVNVDELEKYNPIKNKHQQNAKVAPSTEKEINSRGLFNPFKNESINEGKDDYVARYSGTNITLKKGYKHHTEDELQKLYNKIGELVKDDLKVKDVTIVFESVVTEEKTSFKKGDKLTIDMGDGPEEVTVMGDIDAGISRIKFVSLKRKAGAPYTITVSRLMDALVESKNLMEAQKYDIEAAVKKIRDFNRGSYKKYKDGAVEQLALDILDDLRINHTGGNVDDTIDHLGASMDGDDRIPEDQDLVREIYGITSA